ncbi:NmrA family NAD(P)-binding protein [Dyadobacter sp. LJ53]|uniref:NmrA family NAD(P)-binding protein n=1 Tax=Dyadobacter chenwenxiniae TaxID=2906456 RepID=UPI001F20FA74|nr:NmrA family NAD(P)-binding protein [Dyadobacter chenwenxiniae]MCF0051751.1 NmrA family NAD(P)-binding protein [Dyadobacter chenwenxiniae]
MTDFTQTPQTGTIILAGATGELGFLIAGFIIRRGATVKALVRKGSVNARIPELRRLGAEVIEVDFNSVSELTRACSGGTCVVSALSGLRDVIVETQTRLLNAAVEAGVPRFIPSDYSIDFTRLPEGSNRNLDLRREFSTRLNNAPITPTSILNGMFTDLLTGQAPVVLFKIKRVLYWGDADQPMDFTTMRDTAAYTAAAALDSATPRILRIAGEVATIRDIQNAAAEVTGEKFGTLRAGSLGFLGLMIRITRSLSPKNDEVFPPWQGMQYLHNMLSGKPKLNPLDNDRYPEIRWTLIREVLATAR